MAKGLWGGRWSVLELLSGDGCTTLRMYQTLLSYAKWEMVTGVSGISRD